jgi:hypothetical protein
MSFIRASNDGPQWVDEADTSGLYVYSDGERICYMPSEERQFVEVVMRMLDQSGELTDDELNAVLSAFETRLRWDDEQISWGEP